MMSDNILLIKYNNLNQEYYARRLNNKFLEYKFLGLVNKNNKLTYICTSPMFRLLTFDKVSDELKDKTQYSVKAFDKRFSEDTIYFHYFLPSFKTTTPILLDKKVKGLRYAEENEKKIITKEIIKLWLNYEPLTFKDKLRNSEKYQAIYEKCMEYEIMDTLFELENNPEELKLNDKSRISEIRKINK